MNENPIAKTLNVIGWIIITMGFITGIIIMFNLSGAFFGELNFHQFIDGIFFMFAGFISGMLFMGLGSLLQTASEIRDIQWSHYKLIYDSMPKKDEPKKPMGNSKVNLSKTAAADYKMKSFDE